MMKRMFLAAAAMLCAAMLNAQEIRSIDIKVYLNDEGDAYVEQNWDVTVVRGTEWYIPIENLNGSKIIGLHVEENGVEFIDEGRKWKTDRSLEEKAGRSGIIDKGSDGVELCWGQGSMGDHKWKASFVVTGMVQSLKDYDAFNFMFVNPGLIAPPQHASLRVIRLSDQPFTADSTRFWVFGCDGNIELEDDGTVFFETESYIPYNGKLILMMCFEKGMFNSSNVRSITFDKMKNKAFKGSSYKQKKSFEDIMGEILFWIFVVGVLGIGLLIIYLIIREIVLKITGRIWSPKVFGSSKPRGWEREAPFGGSIPVAVALLESGNRLVFADKHPERRIGAYFLKWISEGLVTPVKTDGKHYDLVFPKEMPDFADDCEARLFQKALEAAGDNNILENGEFKSWSEKHYNSMVNWPKTVAGTGKSKLAVFQGDKVAEAKKLLQFKNFLSEFTLSREREVPEVSLWGKYLVFAELFGIADKVTAGLSKLYPEQFEEYSRKYGMDTATMQTFVHSWTYNSTKAYKAAYDKKISAEAAASSRAAGGHGGHSSFGGGGGFSGGGFGGGSR